LIASHLIALILFSALVSSVFATLLRDERAARLRFGLIVFGAFVASAFVIGWLMYPFPN
jgi:hypothetical protein